MNPLFQDLLTRPDVWYVSHAHKNTPDSLVSVVPPSGYTALDQLLHGPERIGSGWWHEEARRDYLVAPREHDCALCRAFHDRSSRRWFLQVFSAELGTATATITPFDLISIVPHRDWHA